jgi:hypothetical protein
VNEIRLLAVLSLNEVMLNKTDIFEADGSDKFFNALKTEGKPRYTEAKVFTQNLWERTHSYLDSDLANQLRSQFHQRFWEMYLVASLLDAEQELEKGRSEGPDICIKSADLPKIWIEAVTALPGTGEDAVPKAQLKVVRSVPSVQIKLRLLNVFDTKFKQFKKHGEKNLICDDEPYVIAINAAQVPSASLDNDDVPRIVSSLLPFGSPVITINRHTLEVIDSSYSYQDSLSKTSGTQIPTTSFLNPEYSGISAIIYSNVDVLNFPEELSHGLLLFHNPLARNPLPLGFLKRGYEYWVKDDELKNKNWNTVQ